MAQKNIMGLKLVPRENIQIYCYLYKIENGLRELIIDLLKDVAGPSWYKRRMPGDILEKYLKGRESELKVPWTQLIPHHPIYYVDFPDLKKIIERTDNWKDKFVQIFSRRDILSGTLSEIQVVRNKIAHNRKTTYNDLNIIKGAYTKLSQIIGEKKFTELVSRCTCALNIQERLTGLRKEA